MLDPRMSRFWRSALQSGLIDDRGLSDCWESIPSERREQAEQVDRRLARQAIQLNLITLWQAQQLLAGRFNGFKVGRYILMDLIGQGGMGRVYLAKDTHLDRTVAVKILSADRMKNPRAIARFQREAKVGAQLQHENLVRIYDFGESEGRHFLVMEYIEGRTIGSLIVQQGPIPPAVAAGLGRQIALGLEHAHKKGLVHRDVNPYNILATYDGTAKLADLGLARDLADTDRFTREGATVGTFDYISPEQARHSHSADIRSDIYSLGCTLYHMIAGEVPFATESLPEKLFAHQTVEPVPLDRLVPEISRGLAEGIGRMMRKSPDDRFSTPQQVAQMLEPFAESAGPADPGDLVARSREPIRPGPEARTLMIPQVIAGTDRGSSAAPASDSAPGSDEAVAPGWNIGAPPPASPSRRGAAGPSPGLPTYASDLDLPLMLDLGPEPSLSEVLAESRNLVKSRTSTGSVSGVWWSRSWAAQNWRRLKPLFARPGPMAGLLLAISLAAGGFALFRMNRPERELPRPPRAVPPLPVEKSATVLPPRVGSTAKERLEPPPGDAATSPIVVRSFDGASPDIPARSLREAIDRALGGRGIIVLRNDTPLVLSNHPLVESNMEGKLLIRAEEGAERVLEVALDRPGPFLRSGPGLSLELEGVTIRARGFTPGAAVDVRKLKPSAIIQAAGPLTLRRCDIRLSGGPPQPVSVAVYCDGGNLTVERCRFETPGRAIEIRMYDPTRQAARKLAATIHQSRFDAGGGAGHAWALNVSHITARNAAAGVENFQLSLDHCTFEGSGLLRLSGFSEAAPLRVKMSDCVIRTEALIGWDSGGGASGWSRKALPWTGRGNRYEILGKSWILREGSPSGAPQPAPEVIADLDSWTRQVDETPTSTDGPAGADPALIGPSSPASR